MSLGLYLYGNCTTQRDALLEDVRAWVRDSHRELLLASRIGENELDQRTLWLKLHPAEEELQLSTVGRDRVLASARTSGAGPGYHDFICGLLEALTAQYGIAWQAVDPTDQTGDDTGYFFHRDRKRLEATMLQWLKGIARSLEAHRDDDWSGVAVSMPASAPQFELQGAATALGPKGASFWRQAAVDDAVAQSFFPWWESGTGADHLLGRALCRMWMDVRWREPTDEDEQDVHDEVLGLLERARALDSKRPYPWAEWAQLLKLNKKPVPFEVPKGHSPQVGYRRGALTVRPFPGASVRIPGSFAETFDKKGSWCAWEDGRTVWLSLLTAKPGTTPKVPQPLTEPARDQTIENGERVQRLRGKWVVQSAHDIRVLMATVLYSDLADAGWAEKTWASVRFE